MKEGLFCTLPEVAVLLRVSPETVKDWRKKGRRDPSNFKLYVTYIGKKPIVSRNNLERFLDGLPPVNADMGGE